MWTQADNCCHVWVLNAESPQIHTNNNKHSVLSSECLPVQTLSCDDVVDPDVVTYDLYFQSSVRRSSVSSSPPYWRCYLEFNENREALAALLLLACWRHYQAKLLQCPGEHLTGEKNTAWEQLCLTIQLNHQPFCLCSVQVYTADLESALHYLLRVELAAHDYLEGEELNIFKDFVTVVAKVTKSVENFNHAQWAIFYICWFLVHVPGGASLFILLFFSPPLSFSSPWSPPLSSLLSPPLLLSLQLSLHPSLFLHPSPPPNTLSTPLPLFTPLFTSPILPLQLYPVGGSVVKLMKTLSNWLYSVPLQRLSYQKVLDLVDNKMRVRQWHMLVYFVSIAPPPPHHHNPWH